MEYARWAPLYEKIRVDFGFEWARERASADRLRGLLPPAARERPEERIAERLHDRDVVVVGLGPGAGAPPVWKLPNEEPRVAIVAADGATVRCLDAGLVPEIVVTDLDGPVPSEVAANARGALTVVHAHGDNLEAIERWVPEFAGELAGSWAGAPGEGLVNPGGFTDGDRAAYLAHSAGARRVLLWGFDFEDVGAEPREQQPQKRAKLRWARTALDALATSGPPPVLEWTRSGGPRPYEPGPTGPSTQ